MGCGVVRYAFQSLLLITAVPKNIVGCPTYNPLITRLVLVADGISGNQLPPKFQVQLEFRGFHCLLGPMAQLPYIRQDLPSRDRRR